VKLAFVIVGAERRLAIAATGLKNRGDEAFAVHQRIVFRKNVFSLKDPLQDCHLRRDPAAPLRSPFFLAGFRTKTLFAEFTKAITVPTVRYWFHNSSLPLGGAIS
jgi:hypothetical protein